MITSLPNLLTLSRIGAIPAIIALFWVEGDNARWVMLGVYTVACITDFFDGYLARSMQSGSSLGKFLDPVADKLLVGSLIFMLVAMDRLAGVAILPGLIILCREILVSGLREFLAELRVGLPVSKLAKWKTTIQMLTLGFLIMGDASPDAIPSLLIGEVGIWIAALLTLITGYDYLRAGLVHITGTENANKNEQGGDTP
jgi:cardiolipin synthase (CMP-forming)